MKMKNIALFVFFGLASSYEYCRNSNPSNQPFGRYLEETEYYMQQQKCPSMKAFSDNIKPIVTNFTVHGLGEVEGIGLNISWGIDRLHSIKTLAGFLVTIKKNRQTLHQQFLCLNTSLENGNVTFNFNGYKGAQPNRCYSVHITALSKRSTLASRKSATTQFSKGIEPCFANKDIKYTNACIAISVTRWYDCEKRSFEISYSVPSYFSSKAAIRVCAEQELCCKCEPAFPTEWNLPLKGRKNITLPESFPYNKIHSLEVMGKIHTSSLNITDLYRKCIPKVKPYVSVPAMILLGLLFFILVLILSVGFKAGWKLEKIITLLKCSEEMYDTLHSRKSSVQSQKLYLLYVNDHEKHKDVVLKFATLLAYDFDFDVMFELYQQEKIYKDPETWMESCLSEADNILIIWSPGATKRWSQQSNVEGDMFTPVLRKCLRDGLLAKKCCSLFFDYYSKSVVPSDFRNNSISCFNLMKEFENLYFKLSGKQKYASGNRSFNERAAFKDYYKRSAKTHLIVLSKAIKEMHNILKNNSVSSC